MGVDRRLRADAHSAVGLVSANPTTNSSLQTNVPSTDQHPCPSFRAHSFYRIIGATPELYEPGSIGRALGYNGLIIAIFGDALSPPLLSFAQRNATEEEQVTNFLIIKIALLCILLPVSIALPLYLRSTLARAPSTGGTT